MLKRFDFITQHALAPVRLCLTWPAHLSLLPCSIRNLQAELSLVCEERDKLAQELKRTPELIEKTLADLKEQCEPPPPHSIY